MTNRNSKNNVIAMAIIAIILLMGTTGYFWIENKRLKSDIVKADAELKNLTQTQAKLEKDYELAINSLDELKGENQELNDLIEKQKEQLRKQKNKISKLIWKSKKLKEALKEIENLKAQALVYIKQINELKEQNEVLTKANMKLQKDKKYLYEKLSATTGENENLRKEKDSLYYLKRKLEKDNTVLLAKANKASVIKLNKINVKGYKVKSNGKYARRKAAKNIDVLKICFDMLPNDVANPGEEAFYVRLIAPDGTTLYDEKTGSGILTKADDNSAMKYTKKYIVDYNGIKQNLCLIWKKDIPLKRGTYKVEIYNKGYKTAEHKFKLK